MLLISNEEMNNITKPVESLENLGLLIDGFTETVKHGIKIQEGGILGTAMAPMAASLIATMAASLIQQWFVHL